MAKIFVTGATGFIGKRLVYSLLEQGHEVYGLIRQKGKERSWNTQKLFHPIYGDLAFPEKISLPKEIEVCYYLVHSMGQTSKHLEGTEEKIAHNFTHLIEKTKCRQLIFLGGIIEEEDSLSPHLLSRLKVEKVLQKSKVPTTILRASIIIGSGSASFEIIRDLCEKLPIMIAPKWVKSYCQPIAIRDVLFYLTHVLLHKPCLNKVFDIGGPEAMTFKEVLLRYSAFRKLKRSIFDIPFLSPRLSSYWLVLITSIPFSICRYLIESMKHSSRKKNQMIDSILPYECISYEKALYLAFQKIEQNEVLSTWMDTWEPTHTPTDLKNYLEVPQKGCIQNIQIFKIALPLDHLQKKIWSLGGKNGWGVMQWAWQCRGFIDKLLGGIGMNRGRRHPTELQVGDSIDFWRVLLADEENGHLILYGQMKLPGEAWLEFSIDKKKKLLTQTATFRPKGIWGRIYWYSLWPIHFFLFRNMAKKIANP